MTETTGENETLRLFIGIACPPFAALNELLDNLRADTADPAAGLRVVDEGNLHLTLKFLGPTPANRVPEILSVMEQHIAPRRSFTLKLEGAGSFNTAFWLQILADDRLTAIYEDLDSALSAIGFPAENKPFVPHVTVVRLGRGFEVRLQEWMDKYHNIIWGTVPVPEINLYKSETGPRGLQYTVIGTVKLQES